VESSRRQRETRSGGQFQAGARAGREIHAWSNATVCQTTAGAINILYGPQSGMQKAYGFWNAPAAFNQAADLIASTDRYQGTP
jgi:hypothetical protein